ncbi:MAG: hypothetical protein M1511_11260 [Deltaproteobacteria bacterium]|nr:hypothetical protein [Deltaproteobacteria bacterium]
MDEEPLIIALMMAEEERRRLEQKAKSSKKSNARLPDYHQPFQSDQPGGVSRLGWIIIGIIIVVIYLIFRF